MLKKNHDEKLALNNFSESLTLLETGRLNFVLIIGCFIHSDQFNYNNKTHTNTFSSSKLDIQCLEIFQLKAN